jgi:hypothetical protein
VARGLVRFFGRRGIVVLSLVALAAVTSLVAGRSASRPPEPVAAQSAALSPNTLSASQRHRHDLHRPPLAATRARKGHLPKRTVARPKQRFLTKAHSKVFDVRKLKGKVVKRERREVGEPLAENEPRAPTAALPKIVTQRDIAAASAPAPGPDSSFDGLDFATWGAGHPPDTNGDVGPTYYIQTINTSIGIYNKSTGTRVAAFTFNAFMSQGNFGNLCDTDNFGDPVVLYDSFEDRWFITDFAFKVDGSGNISPQHVFQCFAVSKTGDPVSGGWNFYSIEAPGGIDDYPKFGVWADGIYMSANMFGYAASASFAGTHVWALNKAQMYADEPTVQVLDFTPPSNDFTLLPANARLQAGTPPAGTPEYFVSTWLFFNALTVYKLHVDWDKVSTSTFSGPDTPINASSWPNQSVGNAPTPANSNDTLQIRAMAQAQYSNVGGTESLWVDHTVKRVLNGAADVRWYQLNVTGGVVAANTAQGTTWDPDGTDSLWRYMPSLAVDHNGDLAVGYSESNSTTNPAIKYAGRLAGDPVNTFSQTEQALINGTGAQLGNCGSSTCIRWGDYSGMALDPADGCTFWLTNEYYVVNGLDYHTRIGSFQFPGCAGIANGTLSGTVTDGAANPLSGVLMRLGSRSTTTDGSGHYSFSVPAGTYPSLTASKDGYDTSSVSSVTVPDGGSATRNFTLGAAATSGCFTDNTQSSFQRGIPNNCDLVTSPGSVVLARPTVIDQQNQTLGNFGAQINTTTWGGQTFTPAVSGPLTKTDINLFCSGCSGTTPNLTLSIRATSGGLPIGGDLASATIPGFSSGAANWYTGTFASPVTVTAGTQYALVIRSNAVPSAGTYALTRSNSDVYTGGARVSSTNSGGTWTAQTTDAGFRVYINAGYAPSGTFISSLKDANPAPGRVPTWTTLSFTATKPAGTDAKFQVAASNSSFGPFTYVGPDGTAATFFTTSGPSLSQFNGFRYLRYKAYLSTSDSTATPSISSVSVCFDDLAALAHPVADFDGDGKTDVSVYRRSEGRWYIHRSSDNGLTLADFGLSSDQPLPADYDGDGKADLAVYRPSEGRWYIRRSSDNMLQLSDFGTATDIPVPADYDGDGKADLAVYRPAEGRWYIRRSSDNGLTLTDFGLSSDIQVPADYDGDGKADLAVYRPSEGRWYIRRSSDNALVLGDFGSSTDIPLAADYDGDGKADLAVYRPSEGRWYVRRSSDNALVLSDFGLSGDRTEPGDYEGDGKADVSVFRPSEGRWYVDRSSDNGLSLTDFGLSSDVELPLPYAIRKVFFP